MVNFYSTPKSFYNPFVKCSFTYLFCQRLTEVWSSIWFETGLTSSDNLFGFWLLFQITNHFINFASATNIRCYVLPQIRDIKFNVSNTFNVKRSFFICFLVCNRKLVFNQLMTFTFGQALCCFQTLADQAWSISFLFSQTTLANFPFARELGGGLINSKV